MKSNISIDDFVTEQLLKKYFNKLYKICRSILGKGFRESLDIINCNLKKKKLNQEQKLDSANEWNIKMLI